MSRITLRLLFADQGAFHYEWISVDAAAIESHERLIDALREDASILKTTWIDVERLVSAAIEEDDEDDEDFDEDFDLEAV